MDPNKEPGIRLRGVVVDSIRFDDIQVGDSPSENLEYNVRIYRKMWSSPQVALDVTISMLVLAPEPTTSFALEVSVTGRFEPIEATPNLTLEEFGRINGPAIIMPFVREVVANITARSRNGIVLLPAINVAHLVAQETEAGVDDSE